MQAIKKRISVAAQALLDIPIIGPLLRGFKLPGPILAKFTELWKLLGLLKGTHHAAVAEQHERCGDLVQIAPNEISVGDKRLVYIPKLRLQSYPFDATEFCKFERLVGMSNLYSNEPEIRVCIEKFHDSLSLASAKGENIDVRALLTLWAYDVMFATTTGQAAGFLDQVQDIKKINDALATWRFYSVLYGSYLRYHPFIKYFVRFLEQRAKTKIEAFDKMIKEPRIVLALAGADPTIVLIFNAIQHVYANPILAERLRSEIATFRASHAPTFKALILQKTRMPLLHAVLLECARLQFPRIVAPQYAALEGLQVGDQPITPGTLVSLSPSAFHAKSDIFGDEPFSFRPERWLNEELAKTMKFSMLAFNVSSPNPVETLQLLVASKFLTMTVPKFDLAPSPKQHGHYYVINESEKNTDTDEDQPPTCTADTNNSPSIDEEMSTTQAETTSSGFEETASTTQAPAARQHNDADITLPAVRTLETILGAGVADELINGRFAPNRPKHMYPKTPIFTRPIENDGHRYLVHQALGTTHGKRLSHIANISTKVMCIGSYPSIPPKFKFQSRQQVEQHRSNASRNSNSPNRSTTSRGSNTTRGSNNTDRRNTKLNTKGGPSNAGHARPTPPPPAPEAQPKLAQWGSFAVAEERRVLSYNSQEAYENAKASFAQGVKNGDGKETRYTTTYIQRKVQQGEQKAGEQKAGEQKAGEQKAESESMPKVLPPHLRYKLEQEKKQKQTE